MCRLAYSPAERCCIHRERERILRRTSRALANHTVDRCILEGKRMKISYRISTNINFFMNDVGEKFFETSEKEHALEKHFGGAFTDIGSSMGILPKWV